MDQQPIPRRIPIPMRRPFWIKLSRAIGFIVVCYGCMLMLLMMFERSLLYPMPDASSGDWDPTGIVREDVWLDTEDQTRLHGWYLPHDSARGAAIFFHGNGEDVSSCGLEMSWWRDQLGASILVMDYRGYGQSQGKPGEKQLVSDGILACQWLAQREQIQISDVVLWGRSIGGGVAAGVAESTQPRAMVLECTFDSLTNVAGTHFPWVPVRWLMSNKYPSALRLQNYTGELIQWHGDADNIVPLDSATRLHEAIPSSAKILTVGKRMGHNDDSPAEFKANVRDLFERLSAHREE